MSKRPQLFELVGELSLFGARALGGAMFPPYEWQAFLYQLEEIGARSVLLTTAAGLALGVVMTLHTRVSLMRFGAEALAPALQSTSFFNELGPLVTALLIAGRIGAGVGAELANMRASEQIDAIESMSIDSVKLLASTRIAACIVALPVLTLFLDFAALAGGFISEHLSSHTSLQLYIGRAFSKLTWSIFLAPTLKTSVFGLIIGTVSCYFGYTINEGSAGVRRAATNSVVLSSMLVILFDIVLVKIIYFFFPGSPL